MINPPPLIYKTQIFLKIWSFLFSSSMHPSYYVSDILGGGVATQVDEHVPALRALTINRRDSVISKPGKL